MRRLGIAVVAATLLVAACGSNSTTTTTTTTTTASGNDALAAALAAEIAGSPQAGSADFPIDQTAATCWANAIVSAVGPSAAGMATTDADFAAFMSGLSQQQKRDVVSAMFGCVDVVGTLTAQFSTGDTGLSNTVLECMITAMQSNDAFLDAVAASFTGTDSPFSDPTVAMSIAPALMSCMSG